MSKTQKVHTALKHLPTAVISLKKYLIVISSDMKCILLLYFPLLKKQNKSSTSASQRLIFKIQTGYY